MTSRQTSRPLRRSLSRLYAAHRRALALRFAVRAAAAAAIVITLAVLAGLLVPESEGSASARAAVAGVALVAVLLVALRALARTAPGFDAFLERIESRFPGVRSWLRNALDFEHQPPAHTSAELAEALSAETARRLDTLPLATTRPRIEPRRPLGAIAAALVGVVALSLIAPRAAQRSLHSLLDPRIAAPPVRLVVEPGSVRISPGASLSVRARVWGSSRRPTLDRRGDASLAAVSEGTGDRGDHVWRFDLSQLTRELTYRVRVARIASPEYRIALAGEPSAVGFEIEYRAPAYARLPLQRGSATRGDLSALRGTRARVVATFDRDLSRLEARLPGRTSAVWTALTPRRWVGEIALLQDGEYELRAVAPSGEARMRYRLSALPDAPPVLAIQLPNGDQDLPAGQQIPVAVRVEDDLGLGRLRLQYRKDPESPWTAVPLAEFSSRPREASVQSTWDASPLGLLPGQTATFRFEAEDDNTLTGPGRAVSPSFELRFPGLAELYEHIDRQQGDVHQTLEKAADQAREVQKSLERLARQAPRTSPEESPSFERSEELKSALQRQQDLAHQIDQAADQLKQSLEKAAERQTFDDELMTKLREMADLMKQIQSPEFRDALRRMQEALEHMDRQKLEQTLPDWRAENQEMLKQLERTIDLLKQLRKEEQLASLAQKAHELKQQQDALNREHAQRPSDPQAASERDQSLSENQEQAAERTQKLADEARQLASEMQPEDKPKLEQAADQLSQQANPSQRKAASSAKSGDQKQGQQQGEKASESLEQAAEQLDQLVAEAQARRRELDTAAVRRAAQDLLSLQRETEQNLSDASPPSERADQQTDLAEGVARVADSLAVLARQEPFISPTLGEALGHAIQSLQESGRQWATGNPTRGDLAGREGSQSLNKAILELRLTESSMCNRPGSKPKPGGKAGQMLGSMGQAQSQINWATRDLARRLSEQMRLSAGDEAEMRRLANEQQRLREQLEQIQRDAELRSELLGRLDAAHRDMKDVEEALERGHPDGDIPEKQERILSRLLDAQRSVNRRDFDPERESRPGEDMARASAPNLPADLLRESDRLRLDLLKAESDRYPAQYRSYVEAYLRSLNRQRTTPSR